jgi:hypothetical protein
VRIGSRRDLPPTKETAAPTSQQFIPTTEAPIAETIGSDGGSESGTDAAFLESIHPLNVRPAEIEPDQPWPTGGTFPPALTMDYGDAVNGLVAIRAGSLRGNSHAALSQPRQDAYKVLIDGSFIHLAVADGVGSQDHSHIGSELAVQTAVEFSRLEAAPAEIAEAVVQRLNAKAAALGFDPVRLSTTLCWARVSIGAESTPWRVEVAEWGDSELLVYDTRAFRDGHPKWQRLRKHLGGPANSVLALPGHQVIQAQSNGALWNPGEVLGLYSDGVAADIRYDTVLGHALAKAWHTIPSPWEYVGHLAFRYRPANDDRTAITLWRRDPEPQPSGSPAAPYDQRAPAPLVSPQDAYGTPYSPPDPAPLAGPVRRRAPDDPDTASSAAPKQAL